MLKNKTEKTWVLEKEKKNKQTYANVPNLV